MLKIFFTYILVLVYTMVYSQNIMEEVIEMPWNTNKGCKLEQLPHGNVGISTYQVISENELAVLCDAEGTIKVYDMNTNELAYQFNHDKHVSCQLFRYSQLTETFYIFDNYSKILCYSKEGVYEKSIDVPKSIVFDGIVQLKTQGASLYAICGYRNTFTIIDNGIVLSQEEQKASKIDGVYDNNGNVVKIHKHSNVSFEISSHGKDNMTFPIDLKSDYLDNDFKYIGGNEDFIAFVLYSLTTTNPIKIQSQIVFFSRDKGEIINSTDIPSNYYATQFNDIQFYKNSLFQFFTTPDHAVLLRFDYEEGKSFVFSYPDKYKQGVNYNLYKKKIIEDPSEIKEPSESNEKTLDCNENDPTMGSQILYRALRYIDMQWEATANNIVSPQGTNVDIGGDYMVQTPMWISTSKTNVSTPYKWGGFTHYNNFVSEVSNNKRTGDVSCASPFEVSDNRVIGVDCSGFVSRAWNLNEKKSTVTLAGTNISTQYNSNINLKRGDILNWSGHHTCLVRDNNSSLTSVNVIESVAGVNEGRVRYATYTNTTAFFAEYVPRRYNQKLDYDLHINNFETSECPIYAQGSLDLSVTLQNIGTIDYDGVFRAMVYPNYADPNTDVLLPLLFQIGTNVSTVVSGNGGTVVLTFSTDQIPANVAEGTYLVAIEYNRSDNCWPKIPHHDFVGLQQITIVPPVPPEADFTYSPTIGDFPLSVQFTDVSSGNPTGWSWDFGDGGSSTLQNPSHSFISPGTYSISLTVNKNGLTNTKTKQLLLKEGLNARFIANPTSGNVPLNAEFTDISSGSPTQWQWDFGDGSSSNSQNPSKIYSTPGSYIVTLTLTIMMKVVLHNPKQLMYTHHQYS